MLTESLTTIMILAVVVEVVTNGIKKALPIFKGDNSRIVAAGIGIMICIFTETGLLTNLNISINYLILDYIITGIVISRGSSALHDIISIFDEQNLKVI